MNKNEFLQEVAIELLDSSIASDPKRFRQLVANHGVKPEPQDEDLAAQIVGLIQDKKEFFVNDMKPLMYDVGYFDPVSLGVLATKIGVSGIPKLIDKIKANRAEKESNPDNAAKKEGFLKKLFGRKNKGTPTSEADLMKDPNSQELMKLLGNQRGAAEDEPKDETWFQKNKKAVIAASIGLAALIVILVIWLIVRARNKKLAAGKAAA